jgi:hypothetical protein
VPDAGIWCIPVPGIERSGMELLLSWSLSWPWVVVVLMSLSCRA